MNILILAFKGTIAEQVAAQLQTPADKVYVQSDRDWLERFVSSTDMEAYEYILAMGEYRGRDRESIRIETKCTSQFRNDERELRTLAIPYFFKPEPPFKLAKGMGNSWCNLISYQALSNVPNATFSFLHIPRRFNIIQAAKAVDGQLLSLHLASR